MSKNSNSIELNNRVSSLMQNEQYQEAVELLENEISQFEENWHLLWNFGWCYYQLEELDKAQQQLEKALKHSSEHPICKWALGSVYHDRNEFEKAEFFLSESLQAKENYRVRLALGLALMEQGKLKDAEKIHLEAIKIKPNDYERFEAYGDFLFDVGREDESQTMYAKAEILKSNVK